MSRAVIWASLLFLLCLFCPTAAKKVSGVLAPTQHFQYIGKFTFNTQLSGTALRVHRDLLDRNATLMLYMDEI